MKPTSADLQNAPNCGKRTERIRIQFESAAGLLNMSLCGSELSYAVCFVKLLCLTGVLVYIVEKVQVLSN